MKNLELIRPETPERQLLQRIGTLKEKFPDIGINCSGMPLDKRTELCNTAEPSAIQFNPKNVGEMERMITGVGEKPLNTIFHSPHPNFNEQTGAIEPARKAEIIEMLKQPGNPENFRLVIMHLGWKDVASVLDKQNHWRNTELADKVASELADLFAAGIQAGRTMAMENIETKGRAVELFGVRPEHLTAARHKIAEVIASRTGRPVEEVLSKIGYTFDVGHVVKNTHLLEQCPVESWLRQLGQDIKLIHIHDVLPETALPDVAFPEGNKNRDRTDHKALGRGTIDWPAFLKLKKQYCPDVSMILELNDDGDGSKTVQSVDYLEQLEE